MYILAKKKNLKTSLFISLHTFEVKYELELKRGKKKNVSVKRISGKCV